MCLLVFKLKMLNKRVHSLSIFREEKLASYYPKRLENFAIRFEACRTMEWGSIKCNVCNTIVKKNAVKYSCLSPYCKQDICINNRKRIAYKILQSLNIKSRNLFHFIIGFPDVPRFTKDIRNTHSRQLAWINLEMKRLGTPLKMIRVRDIAISKTNMNYIYVHYHCANLPVKDVRKFMQNLKSLRNKAKFPMTMRIAHYRRIQSLYSYFSKRIAGLFEHKVHASKDAKASLSTDSFSIGYFGFQDICKNDITQYFQDFYNTRTVSYIGLRRPEGSSYVPLVIEANIKKCPKCQSSDFSLIPNSLLGIPDPQFSTKPPPQTQNARSS